MMYDLLAANHEYKYPIIIHYSGGLAIQEDPNGYVNVKGLTIKKCSTEEDAIA